MFPMFFSFLPSFVLFFVFFKDWKLKSAYTVFPARLPASMMFCHPYVSWRSSAPRPTTGTTVAPCSQSIYKLHIYQKCMSIHACRNIPSTSAVSECTENKCWGLSTKYFLRNKGSFTVQNDQLYWNVNVNWKVISLGIYLNCQQFMVSMLQR